MTTTAIHLRDQIEKIRPNMNSAVLEKFKAHPIGEARFYHVAVLKKGVLVRKPFTYESFVKAYRPTTEPGILTVRRNKKAVPVRYSSVYDCLYIKE